MTTWPEYESHKVVRAAKIVSIARDDVGNPIVAIVEHDGYQETFSPTEPNMLIRASVGDWAILYPDGYKSISPAKAFEEGYTRKS